MRAELTSRWQQWLNGHPCTKTATLEKAKKDKSHKQRGNVWFNNGHNPVHASLSLRKGDTDMNAMTATLKPHPLAVGSDGSTNILFLEGKVNSQSSAEDHESVYNVKFTTTLGFTLTMGYSRYKDPAGTTHAWICFGDKCSSHWQKELGVDLLLNLVGYRCVYGSDDKVPALSSSVHPAVGGPDMGLSTSSSTPALAQAPVPSAQPLAATMLVPEPSQAPASQAPAPSAQPPAGMVASSATAPAPAQAPAPSAQPCAGGGP